MSGTEKSVNNYSENQGGIIGGLVDGILFGQSSSQPGYPDAPGFEVVAHHAFQSFAKTLKGIK
ncbi:MAG: hypothetical protein NTV06_04700 [candidate division Zixibacteria bacterium]|nr:hypothetical protein [candidate division Zixibacteria bacterium]